MAKKSTSNEMKKEFNKENKWIALILFVSVILLYISIPNIPTKYIASFFIIGVAIYLLMT